MKDMRMPSLYEYMGMPMEMSEESPLDNITLELMNGYTVSGPESEREAAELLVSEINSEMQLTYDEFDDEGESLAMDARDDVVYEYEDQLAELGFGLDEFE